MNNQELSGPGINAISVNRLSTQKLFFTTRTEQGEASVLLVCKTGANDQSMQCFLSMSLNYFDYLLMSFTDNESRVNTAACLGDALATGSSYAKIDLQRVLGKDLLICGEEMSVWIRQQRKLSDRPVSGKEPARFRVME